MKPSHSNLNHERARLLIFGSGSLAESILFTLACRATSGRGLEVTIAGRNRERIDWLGNAANARASAMAVDVYFSPREIDWKSQDSIAGMINAVNPAVVLHTASLQSAWMMHQSNPLTRLVKSAGYGLTLSLQAALLIQLCRAVALTGKKPAIVNACYPDMVNPVMVHLGLPVTVGVGNIAILAEVLHASHRKMERSALKLLANHWHVAQHIGGNQREEGEESGVRLWLEGREISATGEWLAPLQLPDDASLNWVTGATVVPLLYTLLDRDLIYFGHAPGPEGLPGGYPVKIIDGNISLNLPSHITTKEASDWNRLTLINDGVSLDVQGVIQYSETVHEAFNKQGLMASDSFACVELEEEAQRLLTLRAKLEQKY
jgi:hypothetical protein